MKKIIFSTFMLYSAIVFASPFGDACFKGARADGYSVSNSADKCSGMFSITN
ncbi:MAG: hypothetical protein KAQ98_04210 [Bacteriovoracaceae bacterium]|nr:hypothetical protein [Bacteriovoracaceae bacterium]